MFNNPKLIPYLAQLIEHGKSLKYKDRYGSVIKVMVQPLAKLDKLNSDAANVAKMSALGAKESLVIGSNEAGIPIIISCQTLKTYLLDPASTYPGSHLKNEIAITH